MFNPNALGAQKAEAARKKSEAEAVRVKCLQLIPMDLQHDLMVDAKEVICGDPACAPVDTVITLVWQKGGRGMFGIPLAPHEVTEEDVSATTFSSLHTHHHYH